MQRECKVSVIIPVYNVEKYLPACLDSVLNQTMPDFEMICIDDCSPDRCGDILDEYAAFDDRIKVIHLSENRRQGYGRNRGLEQAKGKYVYFLDSDDTILPETFEELTAIADTDNLDAVFFDSEDCFESEKLKAVYTPQFSIRKGEYKDCVYIGSDLFDEFMRQNEWTCYPQRIFWRRQLLIDEGISYPEGSEHEDEYFAFAGILTAQRVRYIRKQYFILRIRPNSVMTSEPAPKNFHGYLMNYFHMNRFVAERGIHTFAGEVNITRMYERISTLYEKLKDRYDLAEICSHSPDNTIYQCYLSYLNAESDDNFYYAIERKVLEEIESYSSVYIYGAGVVGQRFCKRLEMRQNILINGFLVSSMGGNPAVVMGRSVQELGQAKIPDDCLVVVAVASGKLQEIASALDKHGVNWIYYRS